MGGFMKKCLLLVKWVGDIIYKVIKWFHGIIREIVDKIVSKFLQKNKEKILKAENKKLTAKVAAQIKSLQELVKIAEKEKKKLTGHDQAIIEDLFESEECSI